MDTPSGDDPMAHHRVRSPACPTSTLHGLVQPPRRHFGLGSIPVKAVTVARHSPALLEFTPEHSPLPGLLRLSARRQAALPRDTVRRGWTVSQLPSGVDGISFTVHPLGSRGPSDPPRTASMHPKLTPTKRTCLFSAPPRLVVVPRRCLAGLGTSSLLGTPPSAIDRRPAVHSYPTTRSSAGPTT